MINAKKAYQQTKEQRLANENQAMLIIEEEIERAIALGLDEVTIRFDIVFDMHSMKKKLGALGYKANGSPMDRTMTIDWWSNK